MNKRILIYLVATVTWFMFTASTCFIAGPDIESSGDDRFEVQNNTSDTLIWVEFAYPKTLSDINPEAIFGMKWKYMIAPNKKGYNNYDIREGKTGNLRAYFSQLPYGYSTEIFISLDTVKKYGWEDVVKNNRIYQRYDLCYDDVAPIQASMESYDYNSWELWFSVPPTDCMKDVKMWPPYGHYEVIGQ